MSTENEELTIISSDDVSMFEAGQRAEYDIQIATAKKFPRNLARVKENAIAIITMDKATAEQCRYALPRNGKTISGPSVHLARIIVQQYGNIRVDARVKQITDRQIISEAVCFDLETNYAVKVEVRRSIMGKVGRYNDDMITMTGNAANSIAFRNAVFSVIPKGITDNCYSTAMNMITGDLSDEAKLIKRRNEIIDRMKASYNVTEEQILKSIGLRSINQVKSEQIADLIAIGQAIKDGDTTPEQAFLLSDSKSAEESQKSKELERFRIMFEEADSVEKLKKLESKVPAEYVDQYQFKLETLQANGSK